MKVPKWTMLLITAMVLFSPFFAFAQKDSIPDLIPGIRVQLNKIISTTSKANPSKAKAAGELKELLLSNNDLYEKLIQDSDDFVKTFRLINKNLENSNDSLAIAEATETLQAINKTLALGLGHSNVPELQVIVTTVDRNLQPISGLYVYWNFWIDKDNIYPASNFNGFTNPSASGYLRAGIYDIWVKKPGDSTRYPAITQRIKTTVASKHGEERIELKIIVH
jgi:hypothetical protein